jgi:DNA (cytosine-5)-methyltransferase 1
MGGNKTPIIDERQYYGDGESWVENYHTHLKRGGKPCSLHDAPKYLRSLTIEEAKVLHTFPTEFVFCGPKTAIYSQIGNAVPCRLAEVVARAVVDVISGEKIIDGPMLELPLEAGN